ncbi:tellurite resistance TerB family protein [Anabaenopsis tanganyikae CS-531]|uniref:Tellurite resistance TerB family protein n=2 Tax=Anabaenopsis TaxID=110103 RepID=A0ABT5APM4_9CYAN|nr:MULTISPECIES: tellurite resistance TerB family protein [Anabaenopsis]MDB9539265.1 tellurite resistance TerB family protein [Anabaenopsis arnoldii]MDH6091555.1 tellurite resistance TerB family protein [Anabaenopsis arnoldii]MDH6107042.1 tellurite resistance TerB family protein [Anabaenopsis tanganyikae CS-531]
MGLFGNNSNLQTQNNSVLGPAEAFAAITLATVAADGYLTDEEAHTMMATLNRMHLFRSYPNEVLRRMFDKLCSLIKRQGFDGFIKLAVSSLPHDLYETAFAVATDLALADGEVTKEEEDLLNYLWKSLAIPDETAHNIVKVMMIKNKG